MSIRPYPLPFNETARAQAVGAATELGAGNKAFLAEVSQMAKAILKVPVAYTSILEEGRQRMLEPAGVDLEEVPRDMALCSFTIMRTEPLVIPDTEADERFAVNPAVKAPPHVRYYVGAPVILSNGFAVGTVCGVGFQPQDPPGKDQLDCLKRLAALVARYLEEPLTPEPERAEEAKQASERAQEEFLALVSHELRTPLNGILGLVQLMEPKSEEEAEMVEAMTASSEHLDRIVDNVLHFTELTAGTADLDEEEVAILSLVQRVRAEFNPIAKVAGKRIGVGGQALGHAVLVDSAKFQLALSCLVTNAMAHGGNDIRIVAEITQDGCVQMEVQDNGDGIPMERLNTALDVFGTGQPIQQRAADGLGLGLPLTRKLIELHGGEVHYGKRDGTFWSSVTLPSHRTM